MRKLLTEADGRALAIEMLREADRVGLDEACLYPSANGDDVRDGRPQNNFVMRYLKRLRRTGNEDAWRGFASILSDVCATSCEGGPEADYYERLEQEAALRPDVLASLIREPGHA